jgi:hypothetical protein
MTQFIESPQFGVEGGWKLLYRAAEDSGLVRETRVLPVRGLGVLMQTTMSSGTELTLSNTTTVPGVVVIEYLRPVVDEAVRVLHRELTTVAEFEKRQPKRSQKPPAGVVISFNVGNGEVSHEERQQDQEQDPGQVEGEQLDGQQGP